MKRTGSEHEATITALAQTGEGLCTVDGRTVLVPGVLPGERVRLRTTNGPIAELLTIEQAAPTRLEPPCPIVERCGGCTWQHVPADVQRDARLAQLQRALPASVRGVAVEYVPAPAPYRYRTRARLAWHAAGGEVALGFRARARNDVVDVLRCEVLAPALDAAIAPLRAALGTLGGTGEAVIALGHGGAPVVSLRPEAMPNAAGFQLPEALVARGFAGVALWAPGTSAPSVAGDPRPVIQGADGQPLWLASEGFAQANEALNVALAARVAAMADVAGKAVLELYAGAGNFTVLLARDAKAVTAVESDRAASDALVVNARGRGLENVVVVPGDAADLAGSRKADVVVLDPPRTGAREVCEALARRAPRRVVYVSCDPATLGRDLAILGEAMEVTALVAFEMFPQTPHLEVVARLDRRRARPGGPLLGPRGAKP